MSDWFRCAGSIRVIELLDKTGVFVWVQERSMFDQLPLLPSQERDGCTVKIVSNGVQSIVFHYGLNPNDFDTCWLPVYGASLLGATQNG